MPARITITGLNELLAKTRELGLTLQRERLNPVLLEGSKVLMGGIKAQAIYNKQSGKLEGSIIAKESTRQSEIAALTAVDLNKIDKADGLGRREAYPYFVNYGTGGHDILPRFKLALHGSRTSHGARYGGNALRGFYKKVHHPGSLAFYFFAVGTDNAKRSAQRAIELGLIREIQKLGAEGFVI